MDVDFTERADRPLKGNCPIKPGTLKGKDADQEVMDGTRCRVTDEFGFINIKFQLGPVKEFGKNGCQIEDVITALITRLQGFQKGPFACVENQVALDHLNGALAALELRTAQREQRGVEGTNQL